MRILNKILWNVFVFLALGLLKVLSFILGAERLEKREAKKDAIRKSILENGKKATATIVDARVTGSQTMAEERVLMRVKFAIKIDQSGFEYTFVRQYLPVPMPYVSDFKAHNTLRCTVAKHNLKQVLFEFDEKSPAADITFEDSWFS